MVENKEEIKEENEVLDSGKEEQAVKDATRKAKDEAGYEAKKSAKKAVKTVLKAAKHAFSVVLGAILPYILGAVIIITLCCGMVYLLELFTAKDITENIYDEMGIVEDGDLANIVEIKKDDSGDGYHLEFIEDFDTKLENSIKKLNRQNTSIVIKDEDILKQFILAEVKTKYPLLGGEEDGENKFQGTIEIRRYTPDKSIGELKEAGIKELTLKYVDNDTFESLVSSNDANALNTYTLDEDKKLITAVWTSSSDGGMTIEKNSPIDYRNATSAYTMPFEYPLFFYIDTGSEEFCRGLADLAKNSKMVIAVVDNVTDVKTVTTVKETIVENVDSYESTEEGEKYKGRATNSTTTTNETTTIIENVSTSIKLANVESWATKKDCTIDLTFSSSRSDPTISTEGPVGMSDYDSTTGDGRSHTTQTKTTVTTVQSETYNNQFEITESEMEENSENFVKLFNENKKTLNNNLIPSWLFEIMEENDKTVNLIELTKYLLYKATGKNYGVTDFSSIDFSSILGLDEIGSTSGTISVYGISISREDFITGVQNSRCTQVMKDNAGGFYDICKEYNINPAYAFGHACVETGYGTSSICQTKNNYFGMAAYNDSPGASATSYGSILDSVRGYCEWVKKHSTPGTSEYTADNQRGAEFAAVNPVFSGTPSDNIYVLFSRYAVLDSTHHGGTAFDANYMYKALGKGNCGHADGTPTTTLEYSEWAEYTTNERIRIAKELFGTKAFPVVESSTGGDIVSVAKDMMQYMIDNNYNYVQGNYVPLETNESKFGHRVDSSSYVCWVLYRCGYTDASSGGWQLNTDSLPPYLTKKGFKKITSLNELQPGDIVFFPGHVQIYAGKNSSGTRQYFNAGNAPAGNSSVYQTYEPSGFLYAYRMPSVSKGNETNESGNGYTKVYNAGSKKYKLFEQWASNWANNMYAGWGIMQQKGCGPSAVAIILSGYGINCTPMTVVNECTSITNQHGAGTLEAIEGYLKKYELNVTRKGQFGTNINSSQKNEILNHLKQGKPVVVLMRGNITLSNGGSYNYDGHYITLLGINEKNEVYVGDPGSRETDGYTTLDKISNIQVYYLINN